MSTETHYAAWDAVGRAQVRAYCGALIRRRDHANEPTCETCRAMLAQEAPQILALQAMPPNPDPVTPTPFDPLADYTPRVKP